eukprot:3602525-Pleurochrysis_carterae.AAC.3
MALRTLAARYQLGAQSSKVRTFEFPRFLISLLLFVAVEHHSNGVYPWNSRFVMSASDDSGDCDELIYNTLLATEPIDSTTGADEAGLEDSFLISSSGSDAGSTASATSQQQAFTPHSAADCNVSTNDESVQDPSSSDCAEPSIS